MDALPVSYEHFKTNIMSLEEGALKRFAGGEKWQIAWTVQVQSFGKGFLRVTDGQSVARVAFPTSKRVACELGAVVELIDVRREANGMMAVSDVNMVLDPGGIECPMVDTASMAEVTFASTDAMSSSYAMDAFRAHQARRKADQPTPAKERDTIGAGASMTRPAMDAPLTTYPVVRIENITVGMERFMVGPVVVEELMEPRVGANGKSSPTKMVVIDESGTRIGYKSFSSLQSIKAALGDWKQNCYWMARGVAQASWSGGRVAPIHPCEISFQVRDGSRSAVSDNQELLLREGTADQLQWVLRELRRIGQPVAWDPAVRNDSSNRLSVIEAKDAVGGSAPRSKLTVVGVVHSVTRRTTSTGNPFIKLSMVGRRSPDLEFEYFEVNIWSNLTLPTGKLIELFGSEDYDRTMSLRSGEIAIAISDLSVDPRKPSYHWNVGNQCEIEQVHDFPDADFQAVATAHSSHMPVATLAVLRASPIEIPHTVYLATAHVSELRPCKLKSGATAQTRQLAYIDDSRDDQGNFSQGSFRAWSSNPVVPHVIAAGQPIAPTMDAEAPAGPQYTIGDPSAVVIFRAVGVKMAMPMSTQPNARNFINFMQAKYQVVPPDANDERAEALRGWFIETGHQHFQARSPIDYEYMSLADEYDQMVVPRGAAVVAAASSSSSATDGAWAVPRRSAPKPSDDPDNEF